MSKTHDRIGRRASLASLLAAIGCGPLAAQFWPRRDKVDRLPNGRNRDLVLARQDHEKNLEDIGEIRRLAAEVESELEENTEHVVSLTSIEKVERIEDIAKSARKRMRRSY